MIHSWVIDRFGYGEARQQWLEDLYAPRFQRVRPASDKVSQAEVDDEMALFQQAQGVLR